MYLASAAEGANTVNTNTQNAPTHNLTVMFIWLDSAPAL
jgi:hypothetical protein